jgi:hypothetical protein
MYVLRVLSAVVLAVYWVSGKKRKSKTAVASRRMTMIHCVHLQPWSLATGQRTVCRY